MTDAAPRIVDGRYRVLGRLGTGGMADVLVAEDLQLGRKVALKILHRRFAEDAAFVERFRLEASNAAGLSHPNIVGVYDRGSWDGTFYIAMEYVEGRTLKQLVQEDGALEPERAAELVGQVLKAVRFAHSRDIIHRDLKPHNVIVAADDRAKVADFGIAKAGSSELTETGSVMGTAQYLSPEQAEGQPVGPPSDLYSVGVILYELLTGVVPFDGESAIAIALKHMQEAPVPPSQYNAAVSPALEGVVMHALAKDPAARFQTADDFLAALEAAFDESVAPPPAPYVYEEQLEHYPAAPPPEEEEHARWWIPVLAGLLVLGLIGLFALMSGREQVRVPAVVGDQQEQAQAKLERAGFSTDIETKPDLAKPKGQVLGQDPGPGSRAEKGATVTITVSSGLGSSKIPDVEGKGRTEARRALERAHFRVTEKRRSSNDVASGRAIGTEPGAGGELRWRERITLLISSGRPSVVVPGVVGQSEEDATSTLERAGFDVRTSTRENETATEGTVLSQSPGPGTRAKRGSRVTLTIAKAPERVTVPDVIGQSEGAARATLEAAGFDVRSREQDTDNEDEDGQVLSQSPTGKARRGATIAITVGRYTATDTTTTDTTTTGTTTTGTTTTTTPTPPPSGGVAPGATG